MAKQNKLPTMGLWDEVPSLGQVAANLAATTSPGVSAASLRLSIRGRRSAAAASAKLPSTVAVLRPSVRPSVIPRSSVGRGVGVIGPLRRGYSEPTTNIFQGEGELERGRERPPLLGREGERDRRPSRSNDPSCAPKPHSSIHSILRVSFVRPFGRTRSHRETSRARSLVSGRTDGSE